MKRSLYVHRPLVNGDEVRQWAFAQGFKTLLPAEDLHTTICFSKTPIEWPEARDGTITAAGGSRSIEVLGEGAVVLRFLSDDLHARWADFGAMGASWDHDGYRPHVTLTYAPGDVDLEAVEPFPGPLVFGPERFAEIDTNWRDQVRETPKMSQVTSYLVAPFEVKELREQTGEFEGYASIFGLVDQGQDIVEPGAFRASLADHEARGTWPLMLHNHNSESEIGEWTEIREDATGLYVKGRLWIDGPMAMEKAKQCYRSMKKARGRAGLSIGYRTRDYDMDRDSQVRRLKEVALHEISVVGFPMLDQARVLSAKATPPQTIRECEAVLREKCGLSHALARAIAEGGFEHVLREKGGFAEEAAKALSAAGFKAITPSGEGKPATPRDEDGGLSQVLQAVRESRTAFSA